jgi:hypothetical protein
MLVSTTAVNLVVSPASDFAVTATPPNITIYQGQQTNNTYVVSILSSTGFSSPVTLHAAPAGIGASFSLNPVSPGSYSVMTISTSASTTIGSYTIGISGVSGSLSHSSSVVLTVTPLNSQNSFGRDYIYLGDRLLAIEPRGSTATAPPQAPRLLTAEAVSFTRINVNWAPPQNTTGVSAYVLEQCQGNGCGGADFTPIVTIAATQTTYTISPLTPGTPYNHQVRALNSSGTASPPSDPAAATTFTDNEPPQRPVVSATPLSSTFDQSDMVGSRR